MIEHPTQNLSRLSGFDFQPTTRVVFGAHTLDKLGDIARGLGGRHILLVTDRGLMAAGHAQRGIESITKAGLRVSVFQDVQENPTTKHVDHALAFARQRGSIDLIVGLGGGSAMDCAKGVNFLLSNGGKMEDYWGKGLATKPMLPSIGIPTTAGTGSEAQQFALISLENNHRKMACGDIKARFRAVILDPELLVSVPRSVAAATGMDAITHAVESYVTKTRNPYSQLFAREAWRLLEANFETVLDNPDHPQAWGLMLLGAHFSGTAIETSMLGAAHACANPLTALFDITHGTAVSLMLPHVIRFNRDVVSPLYAELARTAELAPAPDPSESLIERINGLRLAAGLPKTLGELGVRTEHCPQLAALATSQWTGKFNPKPVSEADFKQLYLIAL